MSLQNCCSFGARLAVYVVCALALIAPGLPGANADDFFVCPLDSSGKRMVESGVAVLPFECKLTPARPPNRTWRPVVDFSTSDSSLTPAALGYTTGIDPGTMIVRRTYRCSVEIECLSDAVCGVVLDTLSPEDRLILNPPDLNYNYAAIHRLFCPSSEKDRPDGTPPRQLAAFPDYTEWAGQRVAVKTFTLTRDIWTSSRGSSGSFPLASTVCTGEEYTSYLESARNELDTIAKSYCPALSAKLEDSTKPWSISPPCCASAVANAPSPIAEVVVMPMLESSAASSVAIIQQPLPTSSVTTSSAVGPSIAAPPNTESTSSVAPNSTSTLPISAW